MYVVANVAIIEERKDFHKGRLIKIRYEHPNERRRNVIRVGNTSACR